MLDGARDERRALLRTWQGITCLTALRTSGVPSCAHGKPRQATKKGEMRELSLFLLHDRAHGSTGMGEDASTQAHNISYTSVTIRAHMHAYMCGFASRRCGHHRGMHGRSRTVQTQAGMAPSTLTRHSGMRAGTHTCVSAVGKHTVPLAQDALPSKRRMYRRMHFVYCLHVPRCGRHPRPGSSSWGRCPPSMPLQNKT